MDSFAARAKRLHDETDCAVVANLLFYFMAAGRSLRGFASFMLDLAANKPLAQALLERLLETYFRRSEAFLDRAGDCVEAAGDLDGDGHADVLIGAYGNDEGGENAGAA